MIEVDRSAGTDKFAYRCSGKSTRPDPCGSDRVSQTINGVTITYALDQAAGLTQVLSDGSDSYLYGVGRIGEEQPGGWQYHLADALGSVRQLADSRGEVDLAMSYEPFGNMISKVGLTSTTMQFTGEQHDGTALTYLRARYYASTIGIFLSADPAAPTPFIPETLVPWRYVRNNPLNFADPKGTCPTSLMDGLNRGYCEDYFQWTRDRKAEAELRERVENSQAYSPALKPPYIHFSPSVFVPTAVIMGPMRDNIPPGEEVPPGTVGSEFAAGPNSCGEVTLAAILSLSNPDMVANDLYGQVVSSNLAFNPQRGLSAKEIVSILHDLAPGWRTTTYQSRPYYGIEESTGDYWYIRIPALYTREVGFSYLRRALSSGNFPVVGVNADRSTGRLGGSNITYHWSAVTGLSAEWSKGPLWEWVSIYNPFNNQMEYYQSDKFHENWHQDAYAKNRTLIVLSH